MAITPPPRRVRAPVRRPAVAPRVRWLATLAGAAALALLVWNLAPLVSVGGFRPLEDPFPRGGLALALFVAWGVFNRAADRRDRRTNLRMVEALSQRGDGDHRLSADELDIVRARAEDALARLRTQRFGTRWGGRYAYQLPWYLVIGAPGAGKTTAIANAGLGSPLPGGQPVPAMGGTRTCDWWFTDHAVLVDTAGRYTTQDSRGAVDGRVWTGLLDLLKEIRPRQPVNGVILTVSLADLAVWSEVERRAHAAALRERLEELGTRLGMRVPVYVLCTKADLVAGFTAFFDILSREERAQVWGATFEPEAAPRRGAAMAEQVRESVCGLLRRLDERLLERLHQEPDIQRRGGAFALPLHLAALERPLEELLAGIASPGSQDAPPLLRGVYLTSAVQARAAGDGNALPAPSTPAGEPSSFFLERLFPDVVLPEASLTGVDRAHERRRKRRAAGLTAAAAAAAAALVAFWSGSYQGNAALIDRTAAAVAAAEARVKALDTAPRSLSRVEDADFAAVLPALDALRALPNGWLERSAWPPLELTGGLYQGTRLGRPAEAAYRRALRSMFLSRIVVRMEEALRNGWSRPDLLVPALRVYLMMGRREPLDHALVAQWLAADWQRTLPGPANDAVRRSLGDHLAALFEVDFAAIPVDDVLVDRVRKVIEQAGQPGRPPT